VVLSAIGVDDSLAAKVTFPPSAVDTLSVVAFPVFNVETTVVLAELVDVSLTVKVTLAAEDVSLAAAEVKLAVEVEVVKPALVVFSARNVETIVVLAKLIDVRLTADVIFSVETTVVIVEVSLTAEVTFAVEDISLAAEVTEDVSLVAAEVTLALEVEVVKPALVVFLASNETVELAKLVVLNISEPVALTVEVLMPVELISLTAVV